MKKRTIAGLALALTLAAGGAAHATTAGCCLAGKCSDAQAVKAFEAAAAPLTEKLHEKNLELRRYNALEGADMNVISALDSEIRELKAQIGKIAEKQGLPACCLPA